jgi:hypothetical protein
VTDGAPNIDAIRPYRFIRIHNRGTASVAVGLDGKVQNSPLDYWDLVPAGARITRNVGGEKDEPARGLSLLNIDAVNTAALRVEISDSPIIDIDHGQLTGVAIPGVNPVPAGGSGIGAVQAFMAGVAAGTLTPLASVAAMFHTGAGTDSPLGIGGFLLRPDQTAMNVMREGQFTGSQLTSGMPGTATEGTAAATASAAAICTATVAAVAAKFGYLEGFDITIGAPAAAALSAIAVAGLLAGTLTYEVQQATGVGSTLSLRFPRPMRSSAVNTPITVTVPATTNGGVPAVVAYGWTN